MITATEIRYRQQEMDQTNARLFWAIVAPVYIACADRLLTLLRERGMVEGRPHSADIGGSDGYK